MTYLRATSPELLSYEELYELSIGREARAQTARERRHAEGIKLRGCCDRCDNKPMYMRGVEGVDSYRRLI